MPPAPFFPTNLVQWIAVASALGGVAFAVWRWVRQPLLDQIYSVARRVSSIESREANTVTTIEALRRDFAEGQRQTVAAMQGIKEVMAERDTKLRERLVRVETVSQIERKLGIHVGGLDDE